MGDTNKLTDQSINKIDQAIAAAKARKAMKTGTTDGAAATAAKPAKAVPPPAKPKATDEEKAAKLAAREQERADNKAKRDAERAKKLAERSAAKSPAHMKKVQKAAERLSPLGQAATLLFNEATAGLSASDLAVLALHIQHFNRVKATERALGQKVTAGTKVTIVGGDSRYIGKSGTVTKAQRIRCYVTVEGSTKPIYLFTSDVNVEAAQSATATG